MKNGDLVAEHFAYIKAGVRANARMRRYQEMESDILGVVLMRIVRESERFDARGCSFKRFISSRMSGAVIDAIRTLSPGYRNMPVIHEQLQEPDALLCESREPNSAAWLLKGALAELPERSRDVLLMRFRDGHQVKAIGDVVGVTSFRVWQIIREGLDQMRAYLQARGITKVGDVL